MDLYPINFEIKYLWIPMYLEVGYGFLGYINQCKLSWKGIWKCIEVLVIWCQSDFEGFCKLFCSFVRGFSATLERLWRVRGLHCWSLSLFVIVEGGILYLFKHFLLNTNKAGPHWSWTQRRSPGGVNSVIICFLQISWFASLLCIYVFHLWSLICAI